MALVNLAPNISFTLVDESGSKSQMQVSIAPATTVADARTAANALVPLINAASLAEVESYSITFTTVETAPADPGENGRVEAKGLLSFRTAAGKIAQVTVPGIDPAFVLPSDRIEEDGPEVAALVAALLGAPWTDSNGSDLATLTEAYQVFRGTTKRQRTTDRKPDAGGLA